MVEVWFEEMFGPDGNRPLDCERTALVDADSKDRQEAEEKTPISKWRSLPKECLTGPALLEISGDGIIGVDAIGLGRRRLEYAAV